MSNRFSKILLFFVFFAFPFLVKSIDFTVAADGSGDFISIQDAIDASKAFPESRITIFIKNGIYNEKIVVPSCNTKLTLKGEDPEKTIITFNDFFAKINRGRNSTFYTYTLKVEASDLILENITIQNSAGMVGQAVAVHLVGDRCILRNCRFLGNQDTVYSAGTHSRHYFYNCYIEGTTDYIFGEATAYFEKCIIHSKSNSFITAASTPKNKQFGFVFYECKLTAANGVDKVYLGRPWRSFANVAFINCEIGSFVLPAAWDNWSNTENEKTARFVECNNSGQGAATGSRVKWSVKLNSTEAKKYTKEKVFNASSGYINENIEWYKKLIIEIHEYLLELSLIIKMIIHDRN